MSKIFKLFLIFFLLNFQGNMELLSKAEKSEKVPVKESSEKSSRIYAIAAIVGGVAVVGTALGVYLFKTRDEDRDENWRLQNLSKNDSNEDDEDKKEGKKDFDEEGRKEITVILLCGEERIEGKENIIEFVKKAKDSPELKDKVCIFRSEQKNCKSNKNGFHYKAVGGSGTFKPETMDLEQLEAIIDRKISEPILNARSE